jgi:GNAT superfamily N-acetyltransferase
VTPDEDDDPDVGPPPDAPVEYHEFARTYTSVYVFAAVLTLGLVLDLVFGGGVAHLPGWLLAYVLVLSTTALVVYAARRTKSLTLTDTELWVGEEVIARAELSGAASGFADEAPVLGWPNGMPRGTKSVLVTLANGMDVVVPTRFPARLADALHVGKAAPKPQEIRLALEADFDAIEEIDERAEAIFRVAGYELPHIAFQHEELAAAKAVFVFGEPPVGFAWLDEMDGLAHLHELAVIPKRMRQGIGSRLLERACEWAVEQRYPAITLTTYADVAWNAPYYATRGFVEVAELTPGLAGLRIREQNLGLDAIGRRVVMRRELREG